MDALLELLAKQQPQIRLLSAAGEQALQKKAEERPPASCRSCLMMPNTP